MYWTKASEQPNSDGEIKYVNEQQPTTPGSPAQHFHYKLDFTFLRS